MYCQNYFGNWTDETGKVSQNLLVVAKKLTFIKGGEGGEEGDARKGEGG